MSDARKKTAHSLGRKGVREAKNKYLSRNNVTHIFVAGQCNLFLKTNNGLMSEKYIGGVLCELCFH